MSTGSVPAPILRTAGPGDAAALVALLAGGALVAGQEDPDLPAYMAALGAIAADPDNDVLVAEYDGQVVGMCQLVTFLHVQHRGGRCAEIESMHVREDVRGQGIGSALLAEAVRLARAAGCYRVQLTSNNARPEAHRFYERNGFTPSHRGYKLMLEG